MFIGRTTDTFCFDIQAVDPDGDDLTYDILNIGQYNGSVYIEGSTVCVIGDETSCDSVHNT